MRKKLSRPAKSLALKPSIGAPNFASAAHTAFLFSASAPIKMSRCLCSTRLGMKRNRVSADKKPGVRQKQAALSKLWLERNRHRVKAAARRWYQRHLEHAGLQLVVAQATRRRRYVSWANVEAIAALYARPRC